MGNIDKLMTNFSSLLPAIFLSIPFLSTFTHMYNNRTLVRKLYKCLNKELPLRKKKILWFTDTLTEMNGVAITVKEIGWISYKNKKDITIAASLDEDCSQDDLPPNILNIPTIKTIPLPQYEDLRLRVPSFLKTLKMINDFDPDEIYISTPLPIGLAGLGIAKLLNIPAISIYHTDGTMQASKIIDDITMTHAIESYMKWFYSSCNKILVNTEEYATILEERGYPVQKIGLFKRGIDTNLFRPIDGAVKTISETYKIREANYILYAGRISKDKNVDIVIDSFKELKTKYKDLILIMAGEGPYLEELKEKTKNMNDLIFLGRVSHKMMPIVYSSAKLFIFPSITDTFGRVVAEAKACGLPVLVSNNGGPKEIVEHGSTGLIVQTQELQDWISAASFILDTYYNDPEEYLKICKNSRERIINNYSILHFINGLFSKDNVYV